MNNQSITRRNFLAAGITLPVSLRLFSASGARASTVAALHFLDDKRNPSTITENKEKIVPFDLTRLTHWVTPADQFYIRNHFAIPNIPNSHDWVIRVEGNVRRAQQISFNQLREFSCVERMVTLECAGNSKHRNHGLVSNAKWAGVPLRAVLERVGLKPGATHVVFHGADSSGSDAHHFSRALSVQQAIQPEVMLATEMNGKPLPRDHGFPVRLIVPGWYGMAHVKWLERIEVINKPFDGIYQTTHYVNKRAMVLGDDLEWKSEPITTIPVKSIVARVQREYHAAGNIYQISGAVWGGGSPIKSVDINIDEGTRWHPVRLYLHRDPFAWTRWSYQWKNPISGIHTLTSRGIGSAGHRQPLERSLRLRGPYQHDEIILRRVKIS